MRSWKSCSRGRSKKGLELRLDKESSLSSWVIGDERWVRQILLNLLSNAIKFTMAGSVTLRARYTSQAIGMLYCEVEDTGVGIPADKLDLIFEPFTQLAPNAPGHEGTGLGLAICRRMAALMEGAVTATSRVGQGTTFHLTASLAATRAPESVAAPTTQKICGYRGIRKQVLVVDDNPVNTALLHDILTPLGFEVRTAANGREAIGLIQASRPDLLMLDLVMPDIDGVETASELRRHPEFRSIRVIGVSATITDGPRKQAFTEVCDAFLAKPVQLDELLQTIGTLLDLEWKTANIAPSKQTSATLTSEMLAALAPELRKNLGIAALKLDSDQLAALISHIEINDAAVAHTLSDLIKRYDYQAILNALGEECP
ncbi:MAG TPA: ATP-binding protein [Rhodocyclaceae bacterium]|nr:ATP-binding protein [Rhodocyclaceae bacterium]